tara:strand:- start:56 stop:319 length:264 start_codon:yes stop_codon:yes gene_type:complete
MKNWLNLNENTPWIKGYEDTHSNPVYQHCKNPDKWEVKDSRLIMFRYGEGGSIDIRIMENDTDFQHQINITVDDDGKLKAMVTEQTK